MEIRGLSYISGKYTPADYLRLNLQSASSQEDWIDAVNIFIDRIYGRFFTPMKRLLAITKHTLGHNTHSVPKDNRIASRPTEADLIPNGFAVTALACLLMETLMQFREGIPATEGIKVGDHYTKFLTTSLNFSRSQARHFYKDIRCGILHSAETNNGSCLTIEQNHVIAPRENGAIKVDVVLLEKVLMRYFKRYCEDLAAGTDVTLRLNFIKKMDSIMRKWEKSPRFATLWNAICAKKGHELKISSEETLTITRYNDRFLQFDNNNKVHKVDVCEAVCFWNDTESINARVGWEYIVPLLDSCREEADRFIVRAG